MLKLFYFGKILIQHLLLNFHLKRKKIFCQAILSRPWHIACGHLVSICHVLSLWQLNSFLFLPNLLPCSAAHVETVFFLFLLYCTSFWASCGNSPLWHWRMVLWMSYALKCIAFFSALRMFHALYVQPHWNFFWPNWMSFLWILCFPGVKRYSEGHKKS